MGPCVESGVTKTTGFRDFNSILLVAFLIAGWGGTSALGVEPGGTKISVLPDLALSMTDSADPAVAGNTVSYTITFNHNGGPDATGVAVTQFAPENTFFVNSAILSGTGWVNSIIPDGSGGFGAEFSKETVTATDTAQFRVTVRVDSTTAGGTLLNASAGVSANEGDTNAGDNTATEQTTVSTEADLALTISDAPDPTAPGSTITYTVTLANDGPSSAQGVTVTLPTPANTAYVSSTFTLGAGWTLSSSPAVGGTGNVVYSKGAVGKNEGAEFQIVVTTDPSLADGASVDATATAASTTTDPVPANNTAVSSTALAWEADINVSITDSPDPVTAGKKIVYTVPYANMGPNSAELVAITVPVPASTTFVSASVNSGSSWSISTPSMGGTGDVEFTKPSSISGDTAELEVVVQIAADTVSGTTVTGEVSATNTTTDPDSNNNADSTTTNVTTAADVSLQLTDMPDPVFAGNNITYSIAYANYGPSNASNVTVLEPVPANTTFVSASVTSGTGWSASTPAVGGNGYVIFSKAGSAPSDTAEFQITVKVGAGTADGATINASASATSSTPEANPGNESDDAMTTVEAEADLVTMLDESPDPVSAGESLTYTISVGNNGPSNAANVTVTEAVPPNTTFVSASVTSGSDWAVGAPSPGSIGDVEFSKATVAPSETATFEIVVQVAADTANGTTINAYATAQSDTAEASAGNETGATSTTVAAIADLSIVLSDTPDPIDPGDDITYAIDLSNNGPSYAKSVSVTEAVPAGATFVSASVVTGTGWTAMTPAVNGTGNVVFSKSTLPAGEVALFEVVVHVDPGASSGSLVNASASITSTTTDSVPGNNTANETTTVCGIVTIVDYSDTDTVCVGDMVTFTVNADGDPAPDIQWQVDEGSGFVNIPGETGTTLSFTATADHNGNVYRAFVSNNCSDITSQESTLIVNTGTAVTLEPVDVEACVGKKAVFTIDFSGSPEPSVQWQVNDGSGFTDLPGETSKKLRLLNATEDMDGNSYRAILSNACDADIETATATLTVLIVPEVSTNQLIVGNKPASDYTAASDGMFNDKVQVTWSAVDDAEEYQVVRSTTASFSNAVAVTDWIPDLVYDDFDVDTTTARSGCSSTIVPILYYYQVKARGICGESDLSGADTGYVNTTKARYASVLPAATNEDGYHVAGTTDAIAVRLNAGEAIDLASVWGSIYSETALDEAGVSILPVAGSDGSDLWVQYTPIVPWQDGEKVTMTFGASTVSGRGAGPITAVFRIDSGAAAKLSALVSQPSYEDFDASALDLTAELNDQVYLSLTNAALLPILPGSTGIGYTVGPEQPFGTPQRVWIPIPAGADADGLEVYYLDENQGPAQWFPGRSIDGWLASDDYVVLDLDGQQYLGVLVNHGASVLLGPATAQESPVAKASVGGVSGPGGLVELVILLGLAWSGHWFARHKSGARRRGHDALLPMVFRR